MFKSTVRGWDGVGWDPAGIGKKCGINEIHYWSKLKGEKEKEMQCGCRLNEGERGCPIVQCDKRAPEKLEPSSMVWAGHFTSWVKTRPELFHLLIRRTGYWNPGNTMKLFEFSTKKLSPSCILWVKEYLWFGRKVCGTRLTPGFAPSTSDSDVVWEGSNLKHPHRCSESWK